MTSEQYANLIDALLSDINWWERRSIYAPLLAEVGPGLRQWLERRSGVLIHPTVTIHKSAVLSDLVVVERDAEILSGAVIHGPAFIGAEAEIGPNCFLHEGSYVGRGATIGHAAELKASFVLDEAKLYHFSYVGHSIIGRGANLGAGFVTAVRRLDNNPVFFFFQEGKMLCGKKCGALIGDKAQAAVGTLVMPGRQIAPGAKTQPGQRITTNILGKSDCHTQLNDQNEPELQKWIAILDVWDKESDRFWSRANVFLLLNGGLIALIAAASVSPYVGLLVSAGGIFVTCIWHKIGIVGKYYVDRWKLPLKRLEEGWHISPVTMIDRLSEEHDIPIRYQASSTYLGYVISASAVFWGLLFLHFLLPVIQNLHVHIAHLGILHWGH